MTIRPVVAHEPRGEVAGQDAREQLGRDQPGGLDDTLARVLVEAVAPR